MIKVMLIYTLLLGACTDLPAYDADTCGNFTLELGEDCDEDDSRCEECKLRCDQSEVADGFGCSAIGYVCGVDGFCHAPSGTFSELGTFSPFRGRDLAITNVSSDGIGDVVGLATNAISVHSGDPNGQIAPLSSLLTPQQRGFPQFVQLDNDASLDLLVPTADGIAGYSSPEGYIAPHSFAFDLTSYSGCPHSLARDLPFHVFSLSSRYLGVMTTNMLSGHLGLAVIDTTQKNVCPKQLPILCQAMPVVVGDPFEMPPEIDVYPTTNGAVATGQVIGARVAGGLCVVHARHTGVDAAPFQFTDITPDSTLEGKPVFADIADTGCPSLIVKPQFVGAGMREYLGSSVMGNCKLDTSPMIVLPNLGDNVPIGRIELDPVIPGYGKDALVLSGSVIAISEPRGAMPLLLYQSDRALAFVQSGDIDRDGDLDGIAIAGSSTAGAEDIDILARTTAGQFLLRRLDTEQPISNFIVGDYDGDEVADIAYTEMMAFQSERLSVVFGTRDLPLPPVVFGSYSKVVGLCPIQVEDSIDRQNVITDLLVLDFVAGGDPVPGSPQGIPAFTLLHGSPQRTLQSFIDPRTDPNPTSPTVFAGVAAGRFFGSTSIDVIAFEFKPNLSAKVWPMSGNKYGQLESVLSASYDTKIVDCTRGTSTGSFCGNSAHYIAWPIRDSGIDRDVVIGIDDGGELPMGPSVPVDATKAARRIVVIDPTKFGVVQPFTGQHYPEANPLTSAPDPVGEDFRVQSLVRVDLDGNGNPLLAASFRGGALGEPVTGEVRLCEVDDSGMLETCPNITKVIGELDGWTCVDAAVAQLAPRGRDLPVPTGTDLAVLCHRMTEMGIPATVVFRVFYDATTQKRVATPVLVTFDSLATRILVGDVTGDQLDDLAILASDLGSSVLAVFPQCEQSDLACRYPRCASLDHTELVRCVREGPNGDPSVGVGSK